jgi:hypothetical protein
MNRRGDNFVIPNNLPWPVGRVCTDSYRVFVPLAGPWVSAHKAGRLTFTALEKLSKQPHGLHIHAACFVLAITASSLSLKLLLYVVRPRMAHRA